ncbi:hypothetical protein GJ496_005567 [Pomphorhynchus laevis]|nr:hypothetical protein GJ496_005567 [Pomphorhynchus laevis]
MWHLKPEELSSFNVGFVGFGQMGYAISEAMACNVLKARTQIHTYDPSECRQIFSKKSGFTVMNSLEDLQPVDIVVLCVKPNIARDTLAYINHLIKGKLIISVMAGITVETLMQITNGCCRICCVITNLAASVGAASSAFTTSSTCTKEDEIIINKILESFGLSVGRISESCLDATMAIAGSGPALISIVVDALADAGVSNGLARNTALKLAAGMVKGTGTLLLQKDMHPGQLKDAVCSPGGITIKGVEEIEKGNVRSAFIEAINSACKKSKELR